MTISEIESTLRELRLRHQNLDEGMLITLLTAGGWEDKFINDALVLFRTTESKKTAVITPPVNSVIQKTETKSVTVETKTITQTQPVEKAVDVKPIPPVAHKDIPFVAPDVVKENKIDNISKIVYYNNSGEEEAALKVLAEAEEEKKRVVVPPVIKHSEPLPVKKEVALPPVILEVPVIPEVKKESLPHPQVVVPLPKVPEIKKEIPTPVPKPVPVPIPVVIEKSVPKKEEPQSLIIPEAERKTPSKEFEPPENLPLKPFDSTPHVWPFSKYKEVFHGETMPPLPAEERALVSGPSPEHHSKKLKIKRTGFDGEDESLLFLTGTTLLIILLLLAYMYANGRM